MKLVVLLLALLSVLAFACPARANSAAPYSRPRGGVPGVFVESPSPVRVEREDLDIDCGEAVVHPDCRFRATYALSNPAAQEEELLGAFFVARPRPSTDEQVDEDAAVRITLDGADAVAPATLEQRARLIALARSDAGTATLLERGWLALALQTFRIVVPPGGRAKLVFEGALAPVDFESRHEGYDVPPLVQRHVLLGPSSSVYDEDSDTFVYLLAPITHWAGAPDIHLTIAHAAGLDFAPALPGARFTSARDGEIVTEHTVVRASSGASLRFGLHRPQRLVHHGGPVLGIGPRLGREELIVRFGYEIGLAKSFVLGMTADTNFDRYVTTALTLEAATPAFLFIIPSLSFGAGVPVQLREHTDPRVGIRTQLGIQLPLVRVVLPIDVYPAASSSGSHVEASFLTCLSF